MDVDPISKGIGTLSIDEEAVKRVVSTFYSRGIVIPDKPAFTERPEVILPTAAPAAAAAQVARPESKRPADAMVQGAPEAKSISRPFISRALRRSPSAVFSVFSVAPSDARAPEGQGEAAPKRMKGAAKSDSEEDRVERGIKACLGQAPDVLLHEKANPKPRAVLRWNVPDHDSTWRCMDDLRAIDRGGEVLWYEERWAKAEDVVGSFSALPLPALIPENDRVLVEPIRALWQLLVIDRVTSLQVAHLALLWNAFSNANLDLHTMHSRVTSQPMEMPRTAHDMLDDMVTQNVAPLRSVLEMEMAKRDHLRQIVREAAVSVLERLGVYYEEKEDRFSLIPLRDAGVDERQQRRRGNGVDDEDSAVLLCKPGVRYIILRAIVALQCSFVTTPRTAMSSWTYDRHPIFRYAVFILQAYVNNMASAMMICLQSRNFEHAHKASFVDELTKLLTQYGDGVEAHRARSLSRLQYLLWRRSSHITWYVCEWLCTAWGRKLSRRKPHQQSWLPERARPERAEEADWKPLHNLVLEEDEEGDRKEKPIVCWIHWPQAAAAASAAQMDVEKVQSEQSTTSYWSRLGPIERMLLVAWLEISEQMNKLFLHSRLIHRRISSALRHHCLLMAHSMACPECAKESIFRLRTEYMD